jgi:hypothetical protein
VCLEDRVEQTIKLKRARYEPLREALIRRGYSVPKLEVVIVCTRGAVPMSTLATLDNLGLDKGPALTLMRRAHITACVYVKRLCHTRRALEAIKLGAQGICTRFRDGTAKQKSRGRRP